MSFTSHKLPRWWCRDHEMGDRLVAVMMMMVVVMCKWEGAGFCTGGIKERFLCLTWATLAILNRGEEERLGRKEEERGREESRRGRKVLEENIPLKENPGIKRWLRLVRESTLVHLVYHAPPAPGPSATWRELWHRAGLNCAWDFPQYKAIPIATTPFWAMKALNLQERSPTQFIGRTMMQFRTHRGND